MHVAVGQLTLEFLQEQSPRRVELEAFVQIRGGVTALYN